MISLSGVHTILGFLEHIISNPEDKAGLKLAGDVVGVMQDIAKDPRLAQLESDAGTYMALLPKPATVAAPIAADSPSSEQPSDAQRDMGDHAHGNRMDPSL